MAVIESERADQTVIQTRGYSAADQSITETRGDPAVSSAGVSRPRACDFAVHRNCWRLNLLDWDVSDLLSQYSSI